MASLRVDIAPADGETLDGALHALRSGLNVTFDETGVTTAGGNPEIEFTGRPAHLGVIAARVAGEDLVLLGQLLDQVYLGSRLGHL